MEKLIVYILIMIFAANTSIAAELELSDVIKEAREAQFKQAAKPDDIQKNVQQVKNDLRQKQQTCEQSAAEKINPQELMSLPQSK